MIVTDKTMIKSNLTPFKRHIDCAMKYGDGFLSEPPPYSFYKDSPVIDGWERGEPGILIYMHGCVWPHTDEWTGFGGLRSSAKQLTLFWLLKGKVTFKVDGEKHVNMVRGDYVVFDHRKEHMVFAKGMWCGAAWQLKKAPKGLNSSSNVVS